MKKLTKAKRRRLIQLVEYLISGGAYFWTGYAVFAFTWSYLGWSLWWGLAGIALAPDILRRKKPADTS